MALIHSTPYNGNLTQCCDALSQHTNNKTQMKECEEFLYHIKLKILNKDDQNDVIFFKMSALYYSGFEAYDHKSDISLDDNSHHQLILNYINSRVKNSENKIDINSTMLQVGALKKALQDIDFDPSISINKDQKTTFRTEEFMSVMKDVGGIVLKILLILAIPIIAILLLALSPIIVLLIGPIVLAICVYMYHNPPGEKNNV